jgi:NTP pyrophosphatase (non-canonical NTP hydrolase)
MQEIHDKVVDWFWDRDIPTEGTLSGQMEKLQEELDELRDDLINNVDPSDAIGDMMVVLTGIALMCDLSLPRCYELAYEEIKDRKGKMVKGVFVKDV